MNRLSLLFVALVFVCCKKDNIEADEEAIVHFNLTVSGFSQTEESLPTLGELSARSVNDNGLPETVTSLGKECVYLYYLFYNSSGTLVLLKEQNRDEANFGNLSEGLTAGSYDLVINATTTPITLSYSNKLNTCLIKNSDTQGDSFYIKQRITLSHQNTDHQLTLKRINARIDLRLEESVPPAVKKITLLVSNEYDLLKIDADEKRTSSNGLTKSKTLEFTDDQQREHPVISLPVFNTVSPVTATISYYDENNVQSGSVQIPNIQCHPNKKTVLRGSLFSGNGMNISANIDTSWEEEIEIDI